MDLTQGFHVLKSFTGVSNSSPKQRYCGAKILLAFKTFHLQYDSIFEMSKKKIRAFWGVMKAMISNGRCCARWKYQALTVLANILQRNEDRGDEFRVKCSKKVVQTLCKFLGQVDLAHDLHLVTPTLRVLKLVSWQHGNLIMEDPVMEHLAEEFLVGRMHENLFEAYALFLCGCSDFCEEKEVIRDKSRLKFMVPILVELVGKLKDEEITWGCLDGLCHTKQLYDEVLAESVWTSGSISRHNPKSKE
jgi:hypothetical protein